MMLSIKDIVKTINDDFKRLKQDNEDYEQALIEAYGKANVFRMRDFIFNATDLDSVCNPQAIQFFFQSEESPFLTDSESKLRKNVHYERNLFHSYVYNDVLDYTVFNATPTSLDILVDVKKPNPKLKQILEDRDFFVTKIIDFEILEFPHLNDETYFGFISDLTKNLNLLHEVSNKDISKAFRKNEQGLFRDVEKIHLKFAYGHMVDSTEMIIPVYVGIGTNDISGFSFSGDLGKSRYIKYRFDEPESGIEKGILDYLHVKGSLPKTWELDATYFGDNYTFYSVFDINPDSYDIHDDSNRYKGVLMLSDDGPRWVKSNFKSNLISQEDYFDAFFSNKKQIMDFPVLRNCEDLYQLVRQNLSEYEKFADVMYDPQNIVQINGVLKSLEIINKTFAANRDFVNSFNVASDLYFLGQESYERLKRSSVLLGAYIKTGKLEELIIGAANGKNVEPLK